ncbi:GNAT family N-acetyltransferase [Sphingobium sp. DEHP117]|uniref:GNAT family N-acetyltransferase n=1 Tax=Sphingobium sp. DEHP117 TaxID=2993436 RepID=UPI0027D5CEC4|nr:GNAT family N-acetyltransferase [Sphingobium sp. DEHP117]MDQ4418983.1 GNAT family N-acetyltransferase [Sphingobium sp. DEHP117]
MASPIGDMLTLREFDRPDHRAEAGAMAVMTAAFDPRYGEAWTASQLAGFMSMPGVTLLLAQLDQATLGFALMRCVADEAELLLIAVDPKWRDRGVGAKLLENCVIKARKAQVTVLHIEVRENNRAIDFYRRAGFEQVHRRPSYYKGKDGTCYDALSYRLSL